MNQKVWSHQEMDGMLDCLRNEPVQYISWWSHNVQGTALQPDPNLCLSWIFWTRGRAGTLGAGLSWRSNFPTVRRVTLRKIAPCKNEHFWCSQTWLNYVLLLSVGIQFEYFCLKPTLWIPCLLFTCFLFHWLNHQYNTVCYVICLALLPAICSLQVKENLLNILEILML